jgi:hypothetical protein
MEALEIMGRKDVNQLPVMSDGRVESIVSRAHAAGIVVACRTTSATNTTSRMRMRPWSEVRGINFVIASTQAGTALMTTDLDRTGPEERKSIWLGIGKFLFIVVLAVLFFLLAHNMVRHRFFRGGWRNQHGSISP